MNHSQKKGINFGLTSAVITTLGLMVGLDSSTGSKGVVISGILIIAITDALSDAMGIHMSEEAEAKHTDKEIWEATLTTFFSKLVFALTFLIPVLIFSLQTAIAVSIVWGLLVISVSSYNMAVAENKKPYQAILEHFIIAVVVIIITYVVGAWLRGIVG